MLQSQESHSTESPGEANNYGEANSHVEANNPCDTDRVGEINHPSKTRITGEKAAIPHRSPIYSSLVPAYKAFWPAIAQRRIGEVLGSIDFQTGTKLLEVGVGTGISLRHYPGSISVTGIDLSDSMLAEAKERIRTRNWKHVRVLPMNAEQLDFVDNQFDFVTSFHTISVVSDPKQMMREIVRVCRPGGKVLMVNHFRSDNPLIAGVVDRASDITKRLGWRTDLDAQRILGDLPLRLDSRYKTSRVSLFTILMATCEKDDSWNERCRERELAAAF